jgi:hypothetical protein
MRIGTAISALALTLSAVSFGYGQATPAGVATLGVRPNLPLPDGVLHYSVGASEIVQFGLYGAGAVTPSTGFSGNLGYSSTSAQAPFNFVYSGGVFFSDGQGEGVTTFQDIAVSQALVAGKWIFNVADNLNFLPQSPTTGLSGIPGVGDLGIVPIQVIPGGALTNTGARASNTLSGGVERLITATTSVSGSGSWTRLVFKNSDDGIDYSTVQGQVALNHQLTARDTVSGGVNYASYTFDGLGDTFHTKGITGSYSRVMSRAMSIYLSAGPEWIDGSDSTLIPSRLIFSANVGLTYVHKYVSGSINYSRGVNGGSGVQPGAVTDTVMAVASRPLGRDWSASFNVNYTRSIGVITATNGGTNVFGSGGLTTIYGGAQISRALGKNFSTYASYTAQAQSVSNSFAGQNAFDGIGQTLGVGITFAPRATHLGQF